MGKATHASDVLLRPLLFPLSKEITQPIRCFDDMERLIAVMHYNDQNIPEQEVNG